jgi:outer membrane receptor protein involved in Fe transport
VGIAGNPDLKPQATISGEVGLQQALTDDISIDLTGYFRDIRDLAGTRADEITMFGGSSRYSQYVNSDFGFVKGIVFTLTKRMSNEWSATIDYTLQSAKGNASDPATTWATLTSGEQPEIQLIRLGQDQTHTLNMTFAYTSPDMWGFSLIGQFGSGFPYTPSQSINISSLLTNSETKPSFFNVDMKGYYDILLDPYKISLFLRVFNLLDIKNQMNVFGDSGNADFTLSEFLDKERGLPSLVNTVSEYYRDPRNYSEPRRIELGATLYF